MVCSDGQRIEASKPFKRIEASKPFKRAMQRAMKLARLHMKIRNRRKDFLYKVSTIQHLASNVGTLDKT